MLVSDVDLVALQVAIQVWLAAYCIEQGTHTPLR